MSLYRIPILTLTFAALLAAPAARAGNPPRERISINDDWRFTKGDPTNLTTSLLYDVRRREKVRRVAPAEADGNSTLGEPAASDESTNAPLAVIKPWILPTGNEFIKDPAHRFVRAEGNPRQDVSYVQPGFDDSSWQKINLPHDWAIDGPFIRSGGGGMGRLPTTGVGWYRKTFVLSANDATKRISLDIDGAMSYATVWMNGQFVGGWPYGYASWRVDLTPYTKFGQTNLLAIRLDNPPESSRWYPGAGIYRNVWLVKTAPVHVGHWGTFITTPAVSSNSATVHLQVAVNNQSAQTTRVMVTTEVFGSDSKGRREGAAVAQFAPAILEVAAGGTAVREGSCEIQHPRLWGPPPQQRPNRYVAVTTVRSRENQIIDIYETPFGIRTLKFDPNRGFFINGEHVLLNGVCEHHDLGALGAALNERALQRQLEMLQEMGCNALRTSHNPPAPEFLDLADRMGFLVMDESFDVWVRQKTPLDFHLIFADWHEQDLRAQLRRDRNHPSVILWSIGNEVGEQFTGTNGAQIANELNAMAHEEDPTRPTTTAMNWSHPTDPLPAVVDVIGLNYQGAGIRGSPGPVSGVPREVPDQVDFRQ